MTACEGFESRLELCCYIEELPTRTPGVIKFAFFPEAENDPEDGKLTVREFFEKSRVLTARRLKHARPEDAFLIAFYFTGSANRQEKKTCEVRRRSNSPATGGNPVDRYVKVWREAAEKLVRKLYPVSLSPECLRLENVAPNFRQKFLIKVAAYCANCYHHGDVVLPEKKICDEKLWNGASWYGVFCAMRNLLPRRRLIVRDWEIVLINGWISNDYFKMDRYELAAAVNPLLRRELKADTLWKYATRELGLDSARTSGPKPSKV